MPSSLSNEPDSHTEICKLNHDKEILAIMVNMGVDIFSSSYPFEYWSKLFSLLDEVMFAADSQTEMRQIYLKEYPLNPIELLNRCSKSLLNHLILLWIPGFHSLMEQIWSALDEYSFFSDSSELLEEFNSMVYSFYEDRLKWCQETSSNYDGPTNIIQIGLRGMTIEEYCDPYYFPWDGDKFDEKEEYISVIHKYLECLLLPLEDMASFLNLFLKEGFFPDQVGIFIGKECKEMWSQILESFGKYDVPQSQPLLDSIKKAFTTLKKSFLH